MKTTKRSVCLTMILTLICAIGCMFTATAAALLGDVDGNGKVTSADARLILRYSARLESMSDEKVADIDRNGRVNSADARLALRISAKLEPERTTDAGQTEDTTAEVPFELEPNMSIVTDEVCPYCGRSDCPALTFDAKLGATVFQKERAELCPAYVKPTEAETTEEPTPVPEPCEYCGCLIGHNDQCPLYDEHSDAALFCQDCHMPLGFGPDKCVQFNMDIICSECGQPVQAWTCHHCTGR